MIRIDWSAPALDDVDSIARYIGKDSAYYARLFIELLFEAADRLVDFPLSGRSGP